LIILDFYNDLNGCLIFNNEMFYSDGLKKKVKAIEDKFSSNSIFDQNNLVAIAVPRSVYLIASVIACLDCGIVYLPIDIEGQPKNRINYALNSANIQTVVTLSSVNYDFGDRNIIYLDKCNIESDNIKLSFDSELAYILYTSGTTGNPKAVEVTRKGLINFIVSIPRIIKFAENDIIASFTNFTFDIFFLEAVLPLYCGMTVVLATKEQMENPRKSVKLLLDKKVTMLQSTPSRLRLLKLIDSELNCLKNLKTIMIGGEPFPVELLCSLQKIKDCNIYNMYGPTETTIWSSIADLTNTHEIHIGLPIHNTNFYLLDNNLNPVSKGQQGEICIGGLGLADGYLDNIKQTEKSFVYLPFKPFERVYITGDLGFYDENDKLIFIGRKDSQIKINGNRVELEEVEECLNSLKNIDISVVCFDFEHNELIAFYMAQYEIDEHETINELKQLIPDYMIPHKYVLIEKIYYTDSGKVNRKEMLNIYYKKIANSDFDYNKSEIGKKITDIAVNILNSKVIDMSEPLDLIGFDSIKYITFIVELENEFDIEFGEDKLTMASFKDMNELMNYLSNL
jgi:amino acid adenylation domain-containing protein